VQEPLRHRTFRQLLIGRSQILINALTGQIEFIVHSGTKLPKNPLAATLPRIPLKFLRRVGLDNLAVEIERCVRNRTDIWLANRSQ
jgi:hypothetical protein